MCFVQCMCCVVSRLCVCSLRVLPYVCGGAVRQTVSAQSSIQWAGIVQTLTGLLPT